MEARYLLKCRNCEIRREKGWFVSSETPAFFRFTPIADCSESLCPAARELLTFHNDIGQLIQNNKYRSNVNPLAALRLCPLVDLRVYLLAGLRTSCLLFP